MNRRSRIGMATGWALVMTSLSATAFAQSAEAGPGFELAHLVRGAADTVVFALLGIFLLAVGYKTFARIVPWDVDHEISKDHNVAAAIVLGALFLSIAIVIAAALVS